MNWVKQQLANVAGTQEPIYGPSAIQSVADQQASTSYTELTKDDLQWKAMRSTCVETQTFYVTASSGHIGMAQVIYSNVGGVRTTCHFNSKIFYLDGKPNLWNSDLLEHHGFDPAKYSFHADNCAVELSDDGSHYTIKSTANKNCIVDLKYTRVAPGFVAGQDGVSHFGTDAHNPWGSMRHAFWPRCKVEGSFLTQTGKLSMDGLGVFIHALQGMKPHHAAAKWNFANFQSPTYSAVMMQYTTPPSYGSTVVTVGGVAMDGKIVSAGTQCSASHPLVKGDPEVGWPEPSTACFEWHGKTEDNKEMEAGCSGSLGTRIDRVDIMAEVPKFIKQIVAGAAGTRPYIYQYAPKLSLKVKVAGDEREEDGTLYMEATFIS